jgi:hypothetical protein
VAMSEAVKEVKFIYYLFCDISIQVELPIIVKMTILAQCLWHKIALPAWEPDTLKLGIILSERIIKIEFIKYVENQSDIFTKNVTQEIYERQRQNFFGGVYPRGV